MTTHHKVIVMHGYYGCETGCCGHIVEVDDGREFFEFDHPCMGSHVGEEDFEAWARDFAQEVVTSQFGADHVADLDWGRSIVVDD